MLKTIFPFNKRKDVRIEMHATICAFPLIKYEPKTDEFLHDSCRAVQMENIGPTGMAVRHQDKFKKGEIYEFRTKFSIEDKKCLFCDSFEEITDELPLRPFIGKIIWRSASQAGISIIMIHPNDKAYLHKLCSETKEQPFL